VRGISVRGSVVLVTGASDGIGEALSLALAKKGAKILMLARNKEKLANVQNQINAQFPNSAFIFPVDCSECKAVDEVAKTILAQHGIPDILVNNAGVGRWRFLHEMTGDEIKECLNAPFLAATFITRAFLSNFVKRNRGVIFNVFSPSGYLPWAGCTAYAASRFALRGLSEALKADLYSTNVKVQDIILCHVYSNYFTNNPGSLERMPIIDKFLLKLTPEGAANCIINQIESGEQLTVHRIDLRITFWLYGWFPKLITRITNMSGYNTIKTKV